MIHLLGAASYVPYPSWLNPADNTWQMTAATFVGLMSLPGLAVLYASIVPKKWAVNVLAMMFAGFSLVLIVWVLVGLQDGIRRDLPRWRGARRHGVVTRPRTPGRRERGNTSSRTSSGNRARSRTASVNRVKPMSAANTIIPFHFPTASLAYFQFVFAAITPLLFLGSVLGRIKFTRLVPARAAVVDLRLLRRRLHALGRRVLRPGGRARLLGWVRHPHVGRCVRLRGGLGPRTEAPARSAARLAQQPGHGGGRRRHPVAGLERLQRRRPVLRGSRARRRP